MNDEAALPESIRIYFDAVNSDRSQILRGRLHPKALFSFREHRIKGADAIVSWIQDRIIAEGIKYDILKLTTNGETTFLEVLIHGYHAESGHPNPIEGYYLFSAQGDAIMSITAGLMKDTDSIYGLMRDLTMADIERTELQITEAYEVEHSKLIAWEEKADASLQKDIESCRERLNSAHKAASAFHEAAKSFHEVCGMGIGHCLRSRWIKVSEKSTHDQEAIVSFGTSNEKLRKEVEEKSKLLGLRIIDEWEKSQFGDLLTLINQIAKSIPQNDELSLRMAGASIAVMFKTFASAVSIYTNIVGMGNIWRSFLYAFVIEKYGNKLRESEQIDVAYGLFLALLGKLFPLLADASEALEAIKKAESLNSREDDIPSSFTAVKNLREYLIMYAALLQLMESLLSSKTESINKSIESFR